MAAASGQMQTARVYVHSTGGEGVAYHDTDATSKTIHTMQLTWTSTPVASYTIDFARLVS